MIDLSDEDARYLLDHDPTVRKEWTKWTFMSGQAKKPVEERTGRIILLNGEKIEEILAARS